jgi:hypothetical protein
MEWLLQHENDDDIDDPLPQGSSDEVSTLLFYVCFYSLEWMLAEIQTFPTWVRNKTSFQKYGQFDQIVYS